MIDGNSERWQSRCFVRKNERQPGHRVVDLPQIECDGGPRKHDEQCPQPKATRAVQIKIEFVRAGAPADLPGSAPAPPAAASGIWRKTQFSPGTTWQC